MKNLILIVSTLFILAGCTEVKIVVPIDEYDERPTEEEVVELIENDESVPEKPNQTFGIYNQSSDVINAIMQGACWKESAEEDCTLTPKNPRENLNGEDRLLANKEEEMDIYITQRPEEFSSSIRPYQVELLQFGFRDEEGTVIESELVQNSSITFSAPDEEGKTHYYLIHVTWDEGGNKQVYYAFSLYVRESTG